MDDDQHVRVNGGSCATLESRYPFAKGSFKHCFEAKYDDGDRRGQTLVVKEFLTGSVTEDYFYQEEMNIVRDTEEIVRAFNMSGVLGRNKTVKVNRPDIATHFRSGRKYLVEPHIEEFRKFNSNTGWAVNRTESGQAMQALSHFSYHLSSGETLLCDVQGGAYPNGFVLTDPIIMSRTQTRGPGDLGQEGIEKFFENHQCNRFCRSSWIKPGGGGGGGWVYPQKGTVYAPLQTRLSRNPMTGLPWSRLKKC